MSLFFGLCVDNEWNRFLCYRGVYWLVIRRKPVCIKLQMVSPVHSQDLVTGGRTSVSFPCS